MWVALIVAIVLVAIALKVIKGILKLIFGGIGLIIIIGILIAMFNGNDDPLPASGMTVQHSVPATGAQ